MAVVNPVLRSDFTREQYRGANTVKKPERTCQPVNVTYMCQQNLFILFGLARIPHVV